MTCSRIWPVAGYDDHESNKAFIFIEAQGLCTAVNYTPAAQVLVLIQTRSSLTMVWLNNP